MTLVEALELGMECGDDTVEEAIINVEIHSTSLFVYENINRELNELYAGVNALEASGGNLEMGINDAIILMKS